VLSILFSDVVGSTEWAATVGDRHWHELLETHRHEVRSHLARYGGTEVDTAGDGFLATFDSPTSAIRCALAMSDASTAEGLHVRIGLHAGEVLHRHHAITGMAVHIGARVAAQAKASEVLASSTIRELVIGSGFKFTSRGGHQLKGVPGTWELYVVEQAADRSRVS
jgi:class 3 adenylate cyclase